MCCLCNGVPYLSIVTTNGSDRSPIWGGNRSGSGFLSTAGSRVVVWHHAGCPLVLAGVTRSTWTPSAAQLRGRELETRVHRLGMVNTKRVCLLSSSEGVKARGVWLSSPGVKYKFYWYPLGRDELKFHDTKQTVIMAPTHLSHAHCQQSFLSSCQKRSIMPEQNGCCSLVHSLIKNVKKKWDKDNFLAFSPSLPGQSRLYI